MAIINLFWYHSNSIPLWNANKTSILQQDQWKRRTLLASPQSVGSSNQARLIKQKPNCVLLAASALIKRPIREQFSRRFVDSYCSTIPADHVAAEHVLSMCSVCWQRAPGTVAQMSSTILCWQYHHWRTLLMTLFGLLPHRLSFGHLSGTKQEQSISAHPMKHTTIDIDSGTSHSVGDWSLAEYFGHPPCVLSTGPTGPKPNLEIKTQVVLWLDVLVNYVNWLV